MWRVVGLNDSEGVMDVGSGGNIPGVTGQGACAETAHVIAKVSDDRSTNSWGRLEAGDSTVVKSSEEKPPKRSLRIHSLVRYQTRLMSNSITVVYS